MNAPLFISVAPDRPLLRVVKAGWPDPLDTSYSASAGGRWNPAGSFEALYTFGSPRGARAYAWEKLHRIGVVPEDLVPDSQPQLVEVGWKGRVVDVATDAGVGAAGFAHDFPAGVGWARTQPPAQVWHDAQHEGVQYRSATLHRATLHRGGESAWAGNPLDWSEVVVFPATTKSPPRLVRRIAGMAFLYCR